MPQKWQENWQVPKEQAENRQNHINDLGNLTLLRNSLNSSVRNMDFKTKIEGIPKSGRQRVREGYKGNVSLKITEEIIEQYEAGRTEWNEARIDERREQLAEEILKLWPLYAEKTE